MSDKEIGRKEYLIKQMSMLQLPIIKIDDTFRIATVYFSLEDKMEMEIDSKTNELKSVWVSGLYLGSWRKHFILPEEYKIITKFAEILVRSGMV